MATRELPAAAVNAAPNPPNLLGEPSAETGAPACFFHRRCGNTALVEKQGKMLCHRCAAGILAEEFPLRAPTREPLYWTADDLVRQLEMELPRSRRHAGRGSQE